MAYPEIIKERFWYCFDLKEMDHVGIRNMFKDNYLKANNGIATFKDLDMTDMSFFGADFEGCDMSSIDFQKIAYKSLEACVFVNLSFGNQNFEGVDLLDCIFENCDLSNTNLHKAINTDTATFINCKMPLQYVARFGSGKESPHPKRDLRYR